jgi:hypothetical protein
VACGATIGEAVLRSSVTPGSTTGWGGGDLSAMKQFVMALAPQSAAAQLISYGTTVDI